MKSLLIFGSFLVLLAGVAGRQTMKLTTGLLQKNRTPKTAYRLTNADSGGTRLIRIVGEMKDERAISGATVQFKCKVETGNAEKVRYTWYKDDLYISPEFDHRLTITSRSWGSRLRIKSLYTFDSGVYRCEATNGEMSVQTSARLSVLFERPPPMNEREKHVVKLPRGKCEEYKGEVCREFFAGNRIYVDAFENQEEIENHISEAMKQISEINSVSQTCQQLALPAFCYYVFPQCFDELNNDVSGGMRLCKETCEALKTGVCHEEYTNSKKNQFLKIVFQTANCSHLPSRKNSHCLSIGLPALGVENTKCYNRKGKHYDGNVNVSAEGLPCVPWPEHYIEKHSELRGHNYCRNPGGEKDQPWCFVDHTGVYKEICDIEKCEPSEEKSIWLVVAAGGVGLVFVFVSVVIAYCLFRRRRSRHPETSNLFLQNRMPALNLDEASLDLLSQLGESKFGPVYQGLIVDDYRFSNKQPFAFKLCDHQHEVAYLLNFNREIEILSQLDHPNITNLKAVCTSANVSGMVFEFSNQMNLNEYLLEKSPKAIEQALHDNAFSYSIADLAAIGSQIASAMDYLTNNGRLFRDLATRNVLMCEGMTVKICHFEYIAKQHRSSYHQTADGKFYPIRWMAPESFHCWKFSDKTAVWSFGVLLWEMFSYGSQPYCGYSNHEVLDMIKCRQLLSCPDQCPAKIYSLMKECWSVHPRRRPAFSIIFSRLQEMKSKLYTPTPKDISLSVSVTSDNPPNYCEALLNTRPNSSMGRI